MTIQELNDFAAANDLGPNTEITFSDFSGHGTLDTDVLSVAGVDNPAWFDSRTLNIDVT